MKPNRSSRLRLSPLKIMVILTLGSGTNVFGAWWLEAAPENPWLLYPPSWYEYGPGPKTHANRNVFGEFFPLHNLEFAQETIHPNQGESDEPNQYVLSWWGGSRAARTVAQATVITEHEDITIDEHVDIILRIASRHADSDSTNPSIPERARRIEAWITADKAAIRLLTEFNASATPVSNIKLSPNVTEIASGWPLRSMAYSYYSDPTQALIVRDSVELPGKFFDFIDASSIRLPLRPLPLGFAINTLFYGGIIFIAWEGLGFARRSRRRRKGLCAKCAHSLEGLPENARCPECGTEPKDRRDSENQPSTRVEGLGSN